MGLEAASPGPGPSPLRGTSPRALRGRQALDLHCCRLSPLRPQASRLPCELARLPVEVPQMTNK